MTGGEYAPADRGGSSLRTAGAGVLGDGALEKLAEGLGPELTALGAHAGALYLLNPDEDVLELAVVLGLPRDFIGPWERVGIASPIPMADAVRGDDMVWVPGQEVMMRRYPRIALAVPYEFALAAFPVVRPGAAHGGNGVHGVYGGMFLLWPGPQPERMPEALREGLVRLASGVAHELERAAAAGHVRRPVAGSDAVIWNVPGPAPGTSSATELMAARLPEGVCALDIHGRVTSVTPTAARLLGTPAVRLLGARPWELLPWLHAPLYDRYRAAVISGKPTSDTGVRPPDQWLTFELYPDPSGVSIRITPTEVPEAGTPRAEAAQERAKGRAGAEMGALPLAPPGGPPPGLRLGESVGTGSKRPEASRAYEGELPHLTRTGALYHVLHLATAMTEAISVEDVIALVADEIAPAYGAQAVALLTIDAGRLRVLGHRGYPPEVVERYAGNPRYAFSPGARSLAAGRPAFYESMAEVDKDFPYRAGEHDSMASWAFLPLIVRGRAIGTCLFAYAEPHHFTTTERAVLTSLGGLIAQALDRARLYDKKLAVAHGLQQGLLPHILPAVHGLATAARYLPGTEGMDIGGDFYDLIPLGPDTAAAVIGDVQGHNVTAAALMGQIRTAVHAYATADAEPGRILAGTNRLLADLEPGLFASCACLRLDLRRREACLASAGHPQPLVRTPDGAVRTMDTPGGLLLGIESEGEFPQADSPLPVGTTIALYTDGLIESPGVDLGDALAELAADFASAGTVPLDELADVLIQRALEARHRDDDIALLLLRSMPDAP
ncbi:SpoIIE family protein phosphatase [Streptomyces sp. 7N604]|uniref:SpoIIE family protein phosphatase n=1 Tax=Streptomyces sp. 7N604 TaxID=3457415 RepID=UPI003FD09FA6